MSNTAKLARARDDYPSAANAKAVRNSSAALDHAVRVIHFACYLAGSRKLIAEIRNDVCGPTIRAAIARRDTPALFDWLIEALSYQGISDRVAHAYLERHGGVTWGDIEPRLNRPVSCPKLRSYWHFYDCRYQKSRAICAEPDHVSRCPVPTHNLRNGRLNQTAYALYLFIRDVVDGDLVGWIDAQLDQCADLIGPDRLAVMREAVIEPLRHVYGVSDKVTPAKKLTMAAPVFVMFGADEYAKPRAARFSGAEATLLAKAAKP